VSKKGTSVKTTKTAKKSSSQKKAPSKKKATESEESSQQSLQAVFKAAAAEVALTRAPKKIEVSIGSDGYIEDEDHDPELDFSADEEARMKNLDDFEEEEAEGLPDWWKNDPRGIEAKDDEADEETAIDDSDEWTDDGKWDDSEGGSKTIGDYNDSDESDW